MTSLAPALAPSARRALAEGLAGVFADTYSLYLTTQRFHWNVEGPHFQSLHALFQSQYEGLAMAIDALAEAIRALGFYAPGTFREMEGRASLAQPEARFDAAGMVRFLADAHGQVAARVRELLPAVEPKGAELVENLLMARLEAHDEAAWMLRASLGEGAEAL
ncbi:MAG: DNA starvation/stationary phase protection protein [Myxococcales bacterium]|nr:DNA starvation/stationary phase protection protein [Myxococcales bacterium]